MHRSFAFSPLSAARFPPSSHRYRRSTHRYKPSFFGFLRSHYRNCAPARATTSQRAQLRLDDTNLLRFARPQIAGGGGQNARVYGQIESRVRLDFARVRLQFAPREGAASRLDATTGPSRDSRLRPPIFAASHEIGNSMRDRCQDFNDLRFLRDIDNRSSYATRSNCFSPFFIAHATPLYARRKREARHVQGGVNT